MDELDNNKLKPADDEREVESEEKTARRGNRSG